MAIMAIYVALLRGVNVGGNVIKMERLRELWSALGFKNAQTYVQSGNVIFEAEGSPANWSEAIERRLAGESRLPITVIVRSPGELSRVIANCPFLKDKTVDRSKLYVTFLGGTAPKDAAKKLSAINAGADRFHILGNQVYLHCPNGYGRTRLSNGAIEKTLSVRATTRNWNSVNKLHEMASRQPS
jgi:uncharacterized protein (DUF1697 family)